MLGTNKIQLLDIIMPICLKVIGCWWTRNHIIHISTIFSHYIPLWPGNTFSWYKIIMIMQTKMKYVEAMWIQTITKFTHIKWFQAMLHVYFDEVWS